jgi:hypothetical protein
MFCPIFISYFLQYDDYDDGEGDDDDDVDDDENHLNHFVQPVSIHMLSNYHFQVVYYLGVHLDYYLHYYF